MEQLQRVLVTGHAGYIGSVLVPMLVREGLTPVGLDTFFFENAGLPELDLGIEQIRRDVRDVTVRDLAGFDAVIHLAALSNDPMGNLEPELTLDINYVASVRIARLAKEAGVRRFAFSSSCSIYGAAGDEILNEQARTAPVTAYAESKVRTEQELSKLAGHGFSPVYLRNATAYGASPRFRADVVLNNLTCWAVATGKVRIMSDGSPWRPLVHVEDISRAFIAALRAPTDVIHDQAFNVGGGEQNYQVRDIAEVVREVVPGAKVEYSGQGGPDPRNYRVDFSKINRLMPSFQPRWNARSGAVQVFEALSGTGLAVEQFEGRRFTRLAQLRFLLENGELNPELRWTDKCIAAAG